MVPGYFEHLRFYFHLRIKSAIAHPDKNDPDFPSPIR